MKTIISAIVFISMFSIGCHQQTHAQTVAELEQEAARLERKALCQRYMAREPLAIAEVLAKNIDCSD